MNNKIRSLMVRYFNCKPTDVTTNTTLIALGAQEWQIIEMAMEFESVFGVSMDAEKALSLKKVSDWENLII